MADGGGRLAVVAVAVASLAAGIAAGWLGGRASLPPPPPPPTYLNPLRDAVKGETLVHVRPADKASVTYRVLGVEAGTVHLSVEYGAPGSPPTTREVHVARSCFGPLVILEGDVPADYVDTSVKEFQLVSAVPEDLRVESVGRTFHCWKFVGESRTFGAMTYWVSDEVPVHGVVRVTTSKGLQWDLHGFGTPK